MQDSLQYGVHEGTTSGFADDGVGQRCSSVAFAHLRVCSVTWFFQELPGVYDDLSDAVSGSPVLSVMEQATPHPEECEHCCRDQEFTGILTTAW